MEQFTGGWYYERNKGTSRTSKCMQGAKRVRDGIPEGYT